MEKPNFILERKSYKKRFRRISSILLDAVYNEMYKQSESFKNALHATGKSTLTHSMGKNKKSETVLTESEFCKRLLHLRDNGFIESRYPGTDWKFLQLTLEI